MGLGSRRNSAVRFSAIVGRFYIIVYWCVLFDVFCLNLIYKLFVKLAWKTSLKAVRFACLLGLGWLNIMIQCLKIRSINELLLHLSLLELK